MLVVDRPGVRAALAEQERSIMAAVAEAYRMHSLGRTSVPPSQFLRFPGRPRDRIIALPAYLEGDQVLAGVKWVSSFPANPDGGLARASAVMILNSMTTGYPEVLLEASAISAKRTAASAALAARVLARDDRTAVGLIGCGPINLEVLSFLATVWPELTRVDLFDVREDRAIRCQDRCRQAFPRLSSVEVAPRAEHVLARNGLVSIATSASDPYVESLADCPPGAVLLHLSLRDIQPRALSDCDNVTDDPEHVCRERTSLALAEQLLGHRRFIRCSLGDILLGTTPAREDDARTVVFSPFGLGILDLAVARLVVERARTMGLGFSAGDFTPQGWS